jgi:transmembrane sensor
MANPSVNEPSEQHVVEAIQWLVLFESGDVNISDKHAFEQWQQRPEHDLAWQRLGRTSQYFSSSLNMSTEDTMSSIEKSDAALRHKRRSIKTLLSLGGLGLTFWGTQHIVTPWTQHLHGRMTADLSTAVGEQKQHQLADGSTLFINTLSAIDVDFDASPPLTLHYGEIAIQNSSGATLRSANHLFIPDQNSEFSIYRDQSECRLSVLQGQVRCRVGNNTISVLAGNTIKSDSNGFHSKHNTSTSLSWREGIITAEQQTLNDFIHYLARYRPGYLACAEEIASLTLSGSFPITDTDAILANLCQILPIKQQHISRYWVRLVAV